MRRRQTRGISKIGVLGLAILLSMAMFSVGNAAWTDTLTIQGTVTTGEWHKDLGGTCGFWKNWDSHDTYHWWEIEDWLGGFFSGWFSHWFSGWPSWVTAEGEREIEEVQLRASLGSSLLSLSLPTVEDMEAILDGGLGEGHTMEDQFLAHYLATELNAASGRLNPTTVHNFSGYDPTNYLGLAGSGTVPQIINAIEGKIDSSPDNSQYELMKNICDALNNLWV